MTAVPPADDEILRAMNLALAGVAADIGDDEARTPTVFICGAPRSGTTLLYQLLAYVGEVGYVNNLVARFYANPPLGAWLSEQAQVPKVFHPVSSYGRTSGVSSPHEFGRFWLDAFGLEAMGEPDEPIDPDRVAEAARRVRRLASVFGRPLVVKSFDYLWWIAELATALPDSRWIHIRRDHDDNVRSLTRLYEARALDGRPPTWTSATLRATRHAHADAPLAARVGAQVGDLNDHIAAQLATLGGQAVTVTLEDLTADTVTTVGRVLTACDIPWSADRLQEAAAILAATPADE